MKISLFILFFLFIKSGYSQTDTSKLLVGIWDHCSDLDKLDTSCLKPFTYFQLKENGQFEAPGGICGEKNESTLGTWAYKNSGIYISSFKGTCFEMPARGYYNLRFINNDLLYSVYVSKVGENNGLPIYNVFKRRK